MSNLDEISFSIGGLQAQVAHLTDLVMKNATATEKVVRKVEKWEQRAIGISALVSAIVATLGTGMWGKLREWFT